MPTPVNKAALDRAVANIRSMFLMEPDPDVERAIRAEILALADAPAAGAVTPLTLAERVNDALAPLARLVGATDDALDAAAHAAARALEPDDPKGTTTIRIIRDTDTASPRDPTLDLGTMACWSRRHCLGDVQPDERPGEWITQFSDDAVILDLYLLDHSGISMHAMPFGCPWDSGRVGYLVATPDKIRAWFQVAMITPEIADRARAALEVEVKVYDQYLRGEIWGYEITRTTTCGACQHPHKHLVDSCWGFLGETLEETGIRDHVDPALHAALEAAWDNRG